MRRTVFTNAALVGWPEDSLYSVRIDNDRVVFITSGDHADVDKIDLQGRWLGPSMIDWHTHVKLNALTTHRLDLRSASSAREVLDRVKVALDDPRYDLDVNFVGINMRNAKWPDPKVLSRLALDGLSTSRPIFLVFNGYHSICANSMGLEVGGCDPQGHSGYLYEQDAFELSKEVGTLPDEILDQWIEAEARKAAALGVTEIVDLEMGHNIPAWQRRCAKGFDSLRVHAGISGDLVPGTNGLVRVGPYKIVTDGSLGSQTAFCHDVYPGTVDDHGMFAYPPKKLLEMIEWGISHDFTLAVHAIGDRANRDTLDTFALASARPRPGSTIEHAQLLDFDDLPLFRDLGLIAFIQPCHLVDDRDLCHKFWPGREHRAYPFRAIVDAGIPIKMGSDCPVAPLQRWEALAVAISRTGRTLGEEPFCEEQIVDLDVAYAASTSNGKIKLEVGDVADICVLGSNPLKADAAGLRAMQVYGTMLGGSWTYGGM